MARKLFRVKKAGTYDITFTNCSLLYVSNAGLGINTLDRLILVYQFAIELTLRYYSYCGLSWRRELSNGVLGRWVQLRLLLLPLSESER